jgi:hypothetical protein
MDVNENEYAVASFEQKLAAVQLMEEAVGAFKAPLCVRRVLNDATPSRFYRCL